MRDHGIAEARRIARGLVYRLGLSAPEHIRIEAIAKRLGARVVEVRLDGATAQLVRNGEDVRILVSERITDDCVRRFSIAHELAHFVLGHPSTPASLLCGPAPSRRTGRNVRDYEAEANAFAGELLMPQKLLQRACEVSPVSLDVPSRIAREFSVSILAGAIRFVELSPERCAAVFSTRREVSWCVASGTFTREIGRGRRLDASSIAWDFFAKGAIDNRPQPVPADAWFDTSADVDIVEHSIASTQFATVLSLLWIPEQVAPRLGMLA